MADHRSYHNMCLWSIVFGYRTLQHSEVRDLVAECLREAHYPGVELEPQLQPLSGESFKLKSANEEDDARSDVKCVGFWRQAFFDITLCPKLPLQEPQATLPRSRTIEE